MPNPPNPLDRGRSFDILLNTLLEAGLDTTSLAFLLGVNPDTLSAYLLHSSTQGSLNVVPGNDWLDVQQNVIELVPFATYTVTGSQGFPFVRIPGPCKWMLVLASDEGANGIEMYTLSLGVDVSSINLRPNPVYPFMTGNMYWQMVEFPPCVLSPRINGQAGFGATPLGAYLFRVPVGIF